MAWQKMGEVVEAKSEAEDMNINFSVDGPSGNKLRCDITVADTARHSESFGFLVEKLEEYGVITSTERTGLVAVLKKIRDRALQELGYSQV